MDVAHLLDEPGTPRSQKRQPKQRQNRLRPEHVKALAAGYEHGQTRQLAAEFKLHRFTVSLHLDRQDVSKRYQGLTASQTEEVAQRYTNGESLAVVGARFNVDAATVRRALSAHGVQVRPRRGWS
jgi:DNA-directed RNA polymerase specialized sigma24 family protein